MLINQNHLQRVYTKYMEDLRLKLIRIYEEEGIIASGNYAKQLEWTAYRDWETDRKSTRLNSSHSAKSRMPSSA